MKLGNNFTCVWQWPVLCLILAEYADQSFNSKKLNFCDTLLYKKRGYHAISASSYMYDKVWYILLYEDKITSNCPILTGGLINCPYTKCKSCIVGIKLTFFAEESYKLAEEYICFCPYFISNQ